MYNFESEHYMPHLQKEKVHICVKKDWIRKSQSHICGRSANLTNYLKVPKREIFDRSDFPDFYTIKSLCVGDFGVKIKKMLNNN